MNKFLSLLFFILFTILAKNILAQLGDTRLPSYFGIQARAIFPSSFIGNPITHISIEGFDATLTQKPGYSFGGTVRAGITELIAFETGINFTQRYFDIQASVVDSGIFVTNDLQFIQYDIPINALIYIQMTKKWFANASLGVAAGFKPTGVGTLNTYGSTTKIYHTGIVNKKASLDFNGNVGFEYRSKKKGFFYVGSSFRLPIKPLFIYAASYKDQGYKVTQYGNVSGAYLSFDFKYFFKNINGREEIPPPIE